MVTNKSAAKRLLTRVVASNGSTNIVVNRVVVQKIVVKRVVAQKKRVVNIVETVVLELF